jgi:hypothetical protein
MKREKEISRDQYKAKKTGACPFSKEACVECAIYRGRHHYLSFSKKYQGSTDQVRARAKSYTFPLSVEFGVLRKSVEPRPGQYMGVKRWPKIRLKVIDIENKTTLIYDLNGLKKMDWSNPEIWRLIDGRQVTNLESLIEILYSKAENGYEEVELYEAPRFMLLAGG